MSADNQSRTPRIVKRLGLAWDGFDFGLCSAPRPCWSDNPVVRKAIRTTVTTATTLARRTDAASTRVQVGTLPGRQELTHARTEGVIVYLAQSRHTSYGRDSLKLLMASVTSLMANYNSAQSDDMLFLHFGDVNATDQSRVLSLCGSAWARFQLLDSTHRTVPPGTPPRETWLQAKYSSGYRHMIRLYTTGLWGLVAREGYSYVMRMDEDSFLRSPISYNLFARMREGGFDYGYRLSTWESGHWGTSAKFSTFLRQYLESRAIEPEWLLKPCVGPRNGSTSGFAPARCGPLFGIYNNWFVTRVGFWLRPDVQAFLSFIAASNTIYSYRWNDILWQSAAIQIFLPWRKVLHFTDFAYEHATMLNVGVGKASLKCVWYGGIALGSTYAKEATDRLEELAKLPWCRQHTSSGSSARPCVIVDEQTAKPSALLWGHVSLQSGRCGQRPEPYYCRHAFDVHNRSEVAGTSDCACSTNKRAMRSSAFDACFARHAGVPRRSALSYGSGGWRRDTAKSVGKAVVLREESQVLTSSVRTSSTV